MICIKSFITLFISILDLSLQSCPEEVSYKGLSVTWHRSDNASEVKSDPLCYSKDHLVTRTCNHSEWTPVLDELEPCLEITQELDLTSCPPGFFPISENNTDYCYQVETPSVWDYPCFKSGGASVITDLREDNVKSLLNYLNTTNTHRYYWLPAQRQKVFNPLVWYIPGPNWGQPVETNNYLEIHASIFKNCLLLDVRNQIIVTESCNSEYPSLCFYLNDLHYPAKCPSGYHAFRFLPDESSCFGIEPSDTDAGLSFDDFLNTRCKKPMGNDYKDNNNLRRFIFRKIADMNGLTDDMWCWFETSHGYERNGYIQEEQSENESNYTEHLYLEGIINNNGTLSLMNTLALLPCMACETEINYEQTDMIIEYMEMEKQMYLTVYFPSGLWKYDNTDIGIRCFSNAKGFVKVINISDLPFIEVEHINQTQNETSNVEKIVYVINPITERSAQYWCEGHTKNFSLIATNKIIVNPQGDKEHVFPLVIKTNITANDIHDLPDLSNLIKDITYIFDANKVLVMDILEYDVNQMLVLMHLHMTINIIDEDEATNIQWTYNNLKEKATSELSNYNYTFINISSSIYCLPTTTIDFITLDWELTSIGHIVAPKQFCLQANGLPVKRHCHGSYLLGGKWGDVDGHCNENYEPSNTTTFLYNFVKGQMPEMYTTRFLTDGLGFVLSDIDIIIPADIYYLSMSLQHVTSIAQEDDSLVDMGDIENIAWVMDRVLVLDDNYLHLAQTLNSTNVILDSVGDIIEMLAKRNPNIFPNYSQPHYQLAVKPQFVVQISYPMHNNITGIAVIRNALGENFTDMFIQPLYKNTTMDDVLSINNLEIATWIPNKVLTTLRRNTNDSSYEEIERKDIHIVINIFYNDAVFQELDATKHVINSRIIGVSIPGFISNLEYPIPLIFRETNQSNSNTFCGYWDFQTQTTDNIPGHWMKQGCFLVKSIDNVTVCECYHLTHFGQLLNIGSNTRDQDITDKQHTKALNIITLVGSFLSLLGVVGIWVTAIVFHTWRQKAGTKVLLQLSTAIGFPLIFIIIFNLDDAIFIQYQDEYVVPPNMKIVCISLGAFLHYSILASFVWMLITAILQFIRYVRVLGVRRPSRFMFKFTLIGWGIPLIPVAIVLIIDRDNYIPNTVSDINKSPICYPHGLFLLLSVVAPICIILLTNVTLFVLVIYAISRGPDGKMRTTDIDLIGAQLRLSIFLFFLLGLTWIFGIFSFSNNLIWSYLFCLTSTLQGFVLFIYFVVCDPSTRILWITLMKPQFRGSSSRQSITSSRVSISSG